LLGRGHGGSFAAVHHGILVSVYVNVNEASGAHGGYDAPPVAAGGRCAGPWMSFYPVLYIIGHLLCGLAAVMLVPAAVDFAVASAESAAFLASAGVTGMFGGLLILSTRQSGPLELDIRQGFLLTAGAWLALPAFSALPFLGTDLSYTDGVFEAVSGITTTGSTVLVGLDSLPPGILLWRSLLQWIGGVGIIVMAIMLLPFLRIGGMQLFRTESSERSEKVLPSSFSLMAWIVAIYVVLSVACAFAFRLTGMSGFDAINHAMTTLSTGGFSTHDASFGFFKSPAAEWLATLFMAAGALPFIAYIKTVRGEPLALWRDPQAKVFLLFVAALSVAMALWLAERRGLPFLDALRLTAFNLTSVITTTGFASEDYQTWGSTAVGVFFVLTFLGACAGSTSGGIKVYRHQIIWRIVRFQLLRLATPSRVAPIQYGGKRLGEEIPSSVLAFVAVYLATVAVFAAALTFLGIDMTTALSATAQAISNVGPGLGPVVGPAGNFSSLPDAAKWLLALAMLLGRLEIFTILLLFDPEFWRS
jgi:trk system potassium uptake protein TrkH